MINTPRTLVVAAGLAAALSTGVQATFHLMQIEQVIGGVNGDVTAQAVQLRMRTGLQNLLGGARLWVRDATGSNRILVMNFTAGVPVGLAGRRVLITSPGFDGTTSPTAVPDFTMDNLIPAGYLAAGSLTFENNAGTIVYWRLSWGGDAYTGPTTGGIFNDPDGEFGPPWPGPLPSAGVQALQFQGPAAAASSNNADDYALTSGSSVWVNNALVVFSLESPCPWDCGDSDGEVGIVDFLALLGEWGVAGGSCDFDGGGTGITDFLALLGNWGPCP